VELILFGVVSLLEDGGILLGVNSLAVEVSLIVEGEFYIKFHLSNKSDNFKWIVMAVYGPAQEEFKYPFLAELVCSCQHNPYPILIGGDFNILRNSNEKTTIDTTTDGLSYAMLPLKVLILGKYT